MTTDHMLCINWDEEKGWLNPEIKPYGPIKVPTTATSLHYGVSCFDGFIVARNTETGKLQAKDLDKHIERMNKASQHLDLTEFDPKELKQLIGELLKLEERWVPADGSQHIYVRMQHFSMDPTLGVKKASASLMNIFLSPIAKTQSDIKVMSESEIHKNWPRAHSDFTISSLYGPLSPVMAKAHDKGYDSVLWMVDDYIKELTYGNIFVHQKSRFGHEEIVTPAADGTILNGVARQNVMENLKRNKDSPILVERDMSVIELANSHHEDRLYGVFSSSTEKGI